MACSCIISSSRPCIKVLLTLLLLESKFIALSVATGTFPMEFGTITAYQWSHSTKGKAIVGDALYKPDAWPSCQAVHLSAVIRHGERLPEQASVTSLKKLHTKLVNAMDSKNPNVAVSDWENNFPVGSKFDQALVVMGEMQMKKMGSRIGVELKSLFDNADMGSLEFFTTSKTRNIESAEAFYVGLNESVKINDGSKDYKTEIAVRDDLLRFYATCQRYQDDVFKSKSTSKEYNEFQNGPEMKQVRQNLANKLNVSNDTLTSENAELMHCMCAFELQNFKNSTWCPLYSAQDIQVMEYLADLKGYYKTGPAYPITGQQSCPLVSKMFNTMDDVIAKINKAAMNGGKAELYNRGQFGFGHVATLTSLYAAFGLFEESGPLTADDYKGQADRAYKLSDIIPFSGNLVFLLYKCAPEGNTAQSSMADYHLSLRVNEEFVVLPACNKIRCTYKEVRDYYKSLIDDCDLSKLCKVNNGASLWLPSSVTIWMLGIIFYMI